MKTWECADLFAGGGGTSTGLVKAIRERGDNLNLVAINHDPDAVKSHELNHPFATHLCQDVEKVNPLEAVPSGHLDLLVASPSCTYHSRALGGKPRNFQSRDDARIVSLWAYKLHIDNILVENVPEFAQWGPLDTEGMPIRKEKGKIFNAWRRGLAALGYNIDYTILNAADYGDATSRKRLFLIARKGDTPVHWPVPSFDRKGSNGLKKWRGAREIIDWNIKGESIFKRKKPLSRNTIRRIAAGIRKFGGASLEPFIIQMENGGHVDSIDIPLRTITANTKGGTAAIVEPFILPKEGYYRGNTPKSLDDPIGAIPAGRAYGHLIEPFILSQASGGSPRSTDDPIPSIPGAGAHAFVSPYIMQHNGQSIGPDIEDPLPAMTSANKLGLVEPYLIEYYGNGNARSIEEPVPTIPTKDRFGLIEPFLVPHHGEREGQEPRTHSVSDPLPTISTNNNAALVQPEIRLNGTTYRLDIRYRMLQPHELAAAMGFPKGYRFSGTKTQSVKMIGNAVAVNMAKALVSAILEENGGFSL